MREIVTRLYRTDEHRYLYADEINYYVSTGTLNGKVPADSRVQDSVIQQEYTGIEDKNRYGIFEGDIVKYTNEDGTYFYAEVKYMADQGYPAFDLDVSHLGYVNEANWIAEGVANGKIEVVGSIQENSRLLEVE